MKRTIAAIATAIVAVGLAVVGVSTAATASTSITKYGETFVYNGSDSWTVVNTANLDSLHAIGNTQQWLCNYNNVGPGVSPCVDGGSYTFISKDFNNGQSCAYVQHDGGGAWDTVPGDSSKSVCAAEPTSPTATASVTKTTPTCSDGAQLQLLSSNLSHASFGTPAYGTTASDGSRTYDVIATSANLYTFADGTTTKEFTGTLAGPNLALCSTPPSCIARADAGYSYTFTANDAGHYVGGDITVTGPAGSAANAPLCSDATLYVRSTTWDYILPTNGSSPSWSQTLDGTPQDVTVSTLGTFPYAAPDVTGVCQQHDIYATFDTTGFAALTVPTRLDGPGNPSEPAFLHDTLSTRGPNPTYDYDSSTGCTVITPVASLAGGVCYWDAGQQASFKTATLTFDNSASNVPVEFDVTGYPEDDRTVAAGATVTVSLPAAYSGGVNYQVTAGGQTFQLGIGGYSECPPTIQTCSAISGTVTSTNLLPNGWTYTQTRANGHVVYVPGALHVSTDGSTDVDSNSTNTDKAAGSYTPASSIPLSALGIPSMNYTSSSGSLPGIVLSIDKDGDGGSDGDLVYQGGIGSNPSGLTGIGGWWATKDLGVGDAGAPDPSTQKSWGTLDQYLARYPNATITAIGFSLGAGVKGDGLITSITAGCQDFTFDRIDSPTAAPAPVTFQDVCGTASDAVFVPTPSSADHYSYRTIDDRDSKGVGLVTVDAIPDAGFAFPSGSMTTWSHTFLSDAANRCAVVAGDPTASPQTCAATPPNATVSGFITVRASDHVSYTIHSTETVPTHADVVGVLSGETDLPIGHYEVTAVADPGWTLTNGAVTKSVQITNDLTNCQLPSHAAFTPSVSGTDPVCSNGTLTSGSLVIDPADGLNYSVGGTRLTAARTAFPAGVYSVNATAVNPGDTVLQPNPVTVTITKFVGVCTQLATLAFTGGSGPSGFLIASAVLLMLGGALIFTRKRRRPRHAA